MIYGRRNNKYDRCSQMAQTVQSSLTQKFKKEECPSIQKHAATKENEIVAVPRLYDTGSTASVER